MQVQVSSGLPELNQSHIIVRLINANVASKELEASNDIDFVHKDQRQIEESFKKCFDANPNDMCSEIIKPLIENFEKDGVDCAKLWKMYRDKLARSVDWTKEEALNRCNNNIKITKEIIRI